MVGCRQTAVDGPLFRGLGRDPGEVPQISNRAQESPGLFESSCHRAVPIGLDVAELLPNS